jgi:hypothetical protein
MSELKNSKSPQLQPPGMGLPNYELYIARILVWLKLKTTTQEKASKIFTAEAQKILAIAEQTSPVLASRRVLIDRLRGLEDSSRYWSLYMTMEHLCIVNRFTIDVIKSFLKGEKPQVVVSTAAVKPREDVDQSVILRFRSICEEFEEAFPPTKNLQSNVTLAHPWFGELNAQQWHFFTGFHMSLHRKQMIKIGEKLNDN